MKTLGILRARKRLILAVPLLIPWVFVKAHWLKLKFLQRRDSTHGNYRVAKG